MDYLEKLIQLSVPKLSNQEIQLIVEFLDQLLESKDKKFDWTNTLRLVRSGQYSTAFNGLAIYINRCASKLALCSSAASRVEQVRSLLKLRGIFNLDATSQPLKQDNTESLSKSQTEGESKIDKAIAGVYQLCVGRLPVTEEIEIWKNNFKNGLPWHDFFLSIQSGKEGQKYSRRQELLSRINDGEFIQKAYELTWGRGAAAWEIEPWLLKLEDNSVSRIDVLASLFKAAEQFYSDQAHQMPHDGLSCSIMGTERVLTAEEWDRQAISLNKARSEQTDKKTFKNRFYIKSEPNFLVSALASLYRGGDFIEQFMDNITSLDGFDDFCELIIVDADSPENESQTIKRYLSQHKNINYIRCNYRIGIYDAWNMAAKTARGEYLTNTNLDDLRRHDSFKLQAAILENLSFIDVVYQDLYYTFDSRMSFDEIASFGHKTRLPVITPHNMIKFNSPHNAPMWRKKLHDELGYFDNHYKSAGDYEFWIRCLAAGKKFYKINDPHVVYYQNPKGISTRPDTRGVIEAMEIHKLYCRKLISQDVVMSHQDFSNKLGKEGLISPVDNTKDRYLLTQQALRNLARSKKYQHIQEKDI